MKFNVYKVNLTEKMKASSHLFSYYNRALQVPKLVFCAPTGALFKLFGEGLKCAASCLKKDDGAGQTVANTGQNMMDYGIKRGYGHAFYGVVGKASAVFTAEQPPQQFMASDEKNDCVYIIENTDLKQKMLDEGHYYNKDEVGYGVYFNDLKDALEFAKQMESSDTFNEHYHETHGWLVHANVEMEVHKRDAAERAKKNDPSTSLLGKK